MHKTRKRFGQHFLHDTAVIEDILSAIHLEPSKRIVEIGPGLGALTFPILKKHPQLDVIEIDRDLVAQLKAKALPGLTIHTGDVLKFDFNQLKTNQRLTIVGNLPYQISTPLIFHLLTYAECIDEMVFMLQKEVVHRIAAQPKSPDYGRLSVMVQYHCQPTLLFDVPPSAFTPPPKVDSSVVRLIPYRKFPSPARNYTHFADIVRQAFCQRRKTLRNSLRQWFTESDWKVLGMDSQLRPDQLSVADYVKLSNYQQD